MFIELAEALDCPDCREGFGLVAFVREMEGRRVVEGRLGCPQCEIEVSIRGGGVDFRPPADRGAEPDEGGEGADFDSGGEPEDEAAGGDRAVRVAALLGLHERPAGVHLLGPGLADSAAPVAGMAEKIEILALLPPGRPLSGPSVRDRVTPLAGVSGAWPVRVRHLRGVALLGASPREVREAERALASEGRLVVLRPADGVVGAIEGGAFEVLAAEPAAVVASRR